MNEEIEYWKWKNTIIDFNAISDEKIDCNSWYTKKDWIFQYLGCPDERIHEWYNGGFSCEYNTALKYAKELGLVEDYIDYEDEIYTLKHNWNELKKWAEEYLDGARSGLDSYDCGIGDCLDDVLRKMHELEDGGNNESN